uniref:YdbS-like PH domain-containing protein n=1 Tax=Staphylothermus marinus TaxID=2280 RepID=A0A7J3KFI2_STAMA
MSVLWSGKPYIKKTIVKAFILYIILGLFFIWIAIYIPQVFIIYTILVWIFIGFYIYWKRAHTYYLMENSVLITRNWIFGKYQREFTFDRIQNVRVQQGLLAKIFNCGSLVLVTTSRLEVVFSRSSYTNAS